MTIRDLLKKEIEKVVGEGIDFSLSQPPKGIAGDYATNVAFQVAGKRKISQEEAVRTTAAGLIKNQALSQIKYEIDKKRGFINFFLDRDFLSERFLEIAKKSEFLPRKRRREKVLVEYSSPNIGKPLSVAHIRSTIIGDALARIYRALGYSVITDNHLGDWGLQAGMLIAAVKLFSKKSPAKLSLQEFGELYVKFNEAMATHKELEAKAKLETKDLQDGRPETRKIWRIIRQKSLAEFLKLYRLLKVEFDYILGESAYAKLLPWLSQEALKRKVAKESEGAVVIPLRGKHLPPVIVQKSDGGYLYHTFDLATIYWRRKKFRPEKVLYVVSNEQALHFEQLFLAAEKLSWAKDHTLVHVKFGLIRGEDLKRLSTRKGKVIPLEEVIGEAIRRARKIVEEKNPKLPQREKEKIARVVGIGALKYNDLSQNRNTDIIFDWEKMLALEGNSAPYLQYTYARLRSIARKSKTASTKLQNANVSLLKAPEEIALVKKILQFPEAVEDAVKDNLPNILTNYLWELGNSANSFYEKYPVLKAAPGLREARLLSVKAAATVLKQGLSLLGIEAPERV